MATNHIENSNSQVSKRQRDNTVDPEINEATQEPVDLSEVGLTGEQLMELRNHEYPPSPLEGVLDIEPSLHVLVGDGKDGKTSFCGVLALAFAQGISPWGSMPRLPEGRVLFISREQSARKVDLLLARLTASAALGDAEKWTDRVTIIARNPALGPVGRRLLTLDEVGIDTLRSGLEQAEDIGDPYRFLVLDSLSRLKPKDVNENDNDSMVVWMTQLAEVAIDYGIYIMLIHHVGHTKDGPSRGVISAARGASCIGQVAQVVLQLSKKRVKPCCRRLDVEGNMIEPSSTVFQVSEDPEPDHHINRFEPQEPTEEPLDPRWPDIFAAGKAVTINHVAAVIGAAPGLEPIKKPNGNHTKKANTLCTTLQKQGEIKQLANKQWIKISPISPL